MVFIPAMDCLYSTGYRHDQITKRGVNQMQKKFKIIIICLSLILMTMTSCDYFTEEQKTLIDYRYNSEWTEYYTMNDKQYTDHHPESFELLYLITYADGHKERQWETCTRFEYQKAKEELGEVEP